MDTLWIYVSFLLKGIGIVLAGLSAVLLVIAYTETTGALLNLQASVTVAVLALFFMLWGKRY